MVELKKKIHPRTNALIMNDFLKGSTSIFFVRLAK
jgi:hypothetical protein